MVENTKTKTFKGAHRVDLTSKEEQIVQLIVFKLGDEEFGARIDQVREIIRVGPITPIPESPPFISGVTNVRGEITVAIDLKERFSLPGKEGVDEKHIVITEQENSLFGLIVDEVTEVLRIPEEEIKKAPEALKKEAKTQISSVITMDDRLIVMLDLNKLLSDKEFSDLADIANSVKEQQKFKKQSEKEKINVKEAQSESINEAESENSAPKKQSQRKRKKPDGRKEEV